MEESRERQRKDEGSRTEAPNITPMKSLTHDPYGGGIYGTEQVHKTVGRPKNKLSASETQSADGPQGPTAPPKHKPPPSTGDRDIDITGLSYIQ
ncbi:hypothetical protein CDL15_Pgr007221 [Punica granatum]|uniref:Uncharacterized protein n=1 Tax=Punica granatum TaxID=22663 RepID=A0A218X907_PUNGR|nr:hypothetical protein CDL15_Pgr007221 [Punica granatum]PKI51182.1 hypothetical protein CRG98_028469 [Punica granatum]